MARGSAAHCKNRSSSGKYTSEITQDMTRLRHLQEVRTCLGTRYPAVLGYAGVTSLLAPNAPGPTLLVRPSSLVLVTALLALVLVLALNRRWPEDATPVVIISDLGVHPG